jgi:metal-responsive CopG/Arc/MetJ family transcriptional regulator
MLMRQPTLVQLTEALLARLDEHAARVGASRSELIRRAIEEHLDRTDAAVIDRAIADGYVRVPAAGSDAWARAAAIALIAAEPW